MARSDEYRLHANACLRLAEEASSDSAKQVLRMLAAAWHRLAQNQERSNVRPPLSSGTYTLHLPNRLAVLFPAPALPCFCSA